MSGVVARWTGLQQKTKKGSSEVDGPSAERGREAAHMHAHCATGYLEGGGAQSSPVYIHLDGSDS